ncbi:hypothetical protein [Streptomyces sp. NPDC014734]|uniref:hypothetical protein n=1 Tax=Streptomyces sp. NPDC014734 TaxID=3364886 RepID=UPI0036F604D3
MSGLEVNTQGLGHSGEAVEKVADSIKIVRDDYLDKITSYHGCWGTGEFGNTFASKYLDGVEFARMGVKELSEALSGSAKSLIETAAGFRKQQSNVLDVLQHHGGKQR